MKNRISKQLFNQTRKRLPGGVNSPARAFKAVGGNPIFIKSAKGSIICDVDDNKYIDYICSWGALILGHAYPPVIKAIKLAVGKGTSYGMNSENELKLAKIIIDAFPSIEKVRLVNSGTEAVMSALRVARAYTGRDKIIKFEGCYHGHSDSLLVKAGSGATTFSVPDSAGVAKNNAKDTVLAPYNNFKAIEKAIKKNRKEIAAVIIEPIAGNMGVALPLPGHLEKLRKLTRKYGVLLIFDEVITGFRVAYGGVQTEYGIKPDLTTLGKIIGGGMPVGAFGGRKEIMDLLAPEGSAYQAGTFSGNPVTTAAGVKALETLRKNKKSLYKELDEKADLLERGLKAGAAKYNVNIRINRVGSMLTMFFTDRAVYDYQSAMASDTKMFARYFRKMLYLGVNLPPSQFETSFISDAHSWHDIYKTITMHYKSMESIK
jgi:glutamate-1-semialdehyde 2,1-aminomutase